MKLDISRKLDLPANTAFARLSELDDLIGSAVGGHASLDRADPHETVGVGSTWRGVLHIQGLAQEVDLTLSEFDPPNRYVLLGGSEKMAAEGIVEVFPRGEATCEVCLVVQLKGKGFAARMLVSSLGLLGGKLEKRLTKLLDGLSHPTKDRVRRNDGGRLDRSRGSSAST